MLGNLSGKTVSLARGSPSCTSIMVQWSSNHLGTFSTEIPTQILDMAQRVFKTIQASIPAYQGKLQINSAHLLRKKQV
jgi:hypothetical protein